MKPLIALSLSAFSGFLLIAFGACASRPGSSPSVPKPTIEKAADTKIADAGPDESDAAH